jgi:hypothetical protein
LGNLGNLGLGAQPQIQGPGDPGGIPIQPGPSPVIPPPGGTPRGGADQSGAPLRAVRQVQTAFRFREPGSDTHSDGQNRAAALAADQPVVRRRLE